jgi:hypothetical protein
MKLTPPPSPSDDLRYKIEQEVYLTHCTNIANILIAAPEQKMIPRQALIDQYLDAVNAAVET